jgi:hypothetical protein
VTIVKRSAVLSAIFATTYLATWLSFSMLAFNDRSTEPASSLVQIIVGLLFLPGFGAMLLSLPVQFAFQAVLVAFLLARNEGFGVLTYSRWLIYAVAAINTTALAGIFLAFPSRKQK